jgi:hypothetical protein
MRRSDSSVGIATGYEPDIQDHIPDRGKRFLSSQSPDRLLGPPNLLASEYPVCKAAGA